MIEVELPDHSGRHPIGFGEVSEPTIAKPCEFSLIKANPELSPAIFYERGWSRNCLETLDRRVHVK
jgi:hypothetical protein